jgi:protein phosphatase
MGSCTPKHKREPIEWPFMTLDEILISRFACVRIIGDVHGGANYLAAALHEAEAANKFVIQLGDLLRLALDLRERGAGLTIRGNHEDKLFRALSGNQMKIGIDLARTIEMLHAAPNGDALVQRFLDDYPSTPWWVRCGRWFCVHGGFHPAMFNAPGPEDIAPKRLADKCRWLALYGEGRIGEDGDLPKRTYDWIDTVPEGLTVFMGHDVVATDMILERRGVRGGRVMFCDTGRSKGGKLSWVDFDIADLE